MNQEQAEILALKMMGWLAGQDDAMHRFADLSGVTPRDLTQRLDDMETLAGVMDFILSDETLLLAFCDDTNTPAAHPAMARPHLPGGDVLNWP